MLEDILIFSDVEEGNFKKMPVPTILPANARVKKISFLSN